MRLQGLRAADLKILIADDIKVNRVILRSVLRQVLPAATFVPVVTGEEALEALLSAQPPYDNAVLFLDDKKEYLRQVEGACARRGIMCHAVHVKPESMADEAAYVGALRTSGVRLLPGVEDAWATRRPSQTVGVLALGGGKSKTTRNADGLESGKVGSEREREGESDITSSRKFE